MFTLIRETSLPPEVVWARLSAIRDLTDQVPLTTTIADAGQPRVGWRFTVRTQVGPVTFDDAMTVQEWDPPHGWKVVKGGVLGGWASAHVEPYAGGSRLTWTEELWLGSGVLRRATLPVGDVLGKVLFARVVDGLVAAQGEAGSGLGQVGP